MNSRSLSSHQSKIISDQDPFQSRPLPFMTHSSHDPFQSRTFPVIIISTIGTRSLFQNITAFKISSTGISINYRIFQHLKLLSLPAIISHYHSHDLQPATLAFLAAVSIFTSCCNKHFPLISIPSSGTHYFQLWKSLFPALAFTIISGTGTHHISSSGIHHYLQY